jgi:fluoride exporter
MDIFGGGLRKSEAPTEMNRGRGFHCFQASTREGKKAVKVLMQILFVAFGSSLGGLARWGVSVGAARLLGTAFPWGTLFINLSGSLFLGWFTTYVSDRLMGSGSGWWIRPDDLKLLIAVGFTGAYTTFSTFELEAHNMLSDRDGLASATYIAASVFLGLLAVRIGVRLARMG